METIIVNNVIVSNNRISVEYGVSEGIKHFFIDKELRFIVDYDISLEGLPESIAVIPFVCNILPLIWLSDSTLVLKTLDYDFFNSIESFKGGYRQMYPMLSFCGNIKVEKVVRSFKQVDNDKVGCFFSGGVDAYATMFNHLDEKPDLLFIRGSDIDLSDEKGWSTMKELLLDTGTKFKLAPHFIISNFRRQLDEGALGQLIAGSGDGWWHGFQHGIAIISHAAPLSYFLGYHCVNIASTYTFREKGKVTCASDPSIDNLVSFCETSVHHDLYELNRPQKLQLIINEVKHLCIPVKLHVCWELSGGENCCSCEKCYRTIMAIVANGADPNEFGFNVDESTYRQIKKFIYRYGFILTPNIQFWKDVQDTICENWKGKNIPRSLRWMKSFNFDNVNNTPYKCLKHFVKRSHFLSSIVSLVR